MGCRFERRGIFHKSTMYAKQPHLSSAGHFANAAVGSCGICTDGAQFRQRLHRFGSCCGMCTGSAERAAGQVQVERARNGGDQCSRAKRKGDDDDQDYRPAGIGEAARCRVVLRVPFGVRRQADYQRANEAGKNGKWKRQQMDPRPKVLFAIEIKAMCTQPAEQRREQGGQGFVLVRSCHVINLVVCMEWPSWLASYCKGASQRWREQPDVDFVFYNPHLSGFGRAVLFGLVIRVAGGLRIAL